MLAKLEARLKALDKASGPDPFKAPADSARRASGSFLAFQQSIARLETQQGNLAGAAQRLRNVLAQQTTTTTQTINAQRQLLAVEAQLASGTSALGGHFKGLQGSIGALGGAIGGLPGQLLSVSTGIGAVTAAIGIGVGVVKSFGDAFKFKADLDATTASINAQLKGVRDSSEVYAQAAQFATTYKLTQQETTEAIQASIGVMRNSKAGVEDILGVLARLQVLSPEQSLQEAAVALKALASGDTTSLVTRFEVGRDVAIQMKNEILAGADAVAVMSKFLDNTGIGMDVLAAKTTGVAGGFKELAQAQEQLKLAQAAFAQGPGLIILNEQIKVTSGLTRLLTGDFTAMGTSIAATIAGSSAYNTVLAQGGTIAAAAAAQQAAYAAKLAEGVPVAAIATASADTMGLARERERIATSLAADSMEAYRAIEAAFVAGEAAATASAAAHTAETQKTAEAAVLAAAQQAAQTVATQALTQETHAAVNAFLALNPNLDAAGIASAIAAGKVPPLIGQLAQLRLEADATAAALGRLAAQQAGVAGVSKLFAGGVTGQKGAGLGAGGRLGGGGGGLSRENDALAQSERDLALARAGSAAEQIKLLQAQADKTVNLIEKNKILTKIEGLRDKGKGKGAGGAKLSDQTKLNNQLLAGQEAADNKMEDAAQTHADAVQKITEDFYAKLLEAQRAFNLDSLDSRVDFYSALGNIEDHGLQQAMSAKYEEAALKSQQIAKEKGADAGQAFLDASRASIEKQAQIQDEINKVSNKKDKKNFDPDRAEFLRGILAQQEAADAERLRQIEENGSAITSARDKQLADEATKFDTAQTKIETASDRATERQILNAERSGKAVDGVIAKADTLAASYDRVGTAGARAGVTPGATAASPTTGLPVTPQAVPGTAAAADPIAVALDGLIAAVNAVRDATTNAGRGVEGAVSRLSGKFAS